MGDVDTGRLTPTGRTSVSPEEAAQPLVAQIQLEDAQLEEVVAWLVDEITRAKAERSELDDDLVRYERLYDAKPEKPVQDFPWEGASNIVIPVIATAVDAVLARLLNAVFGEKHLWHVTPKSPKWMDLVQPMDNWFDWMSREVLGMYKICQKWFLSCIKFGTGVVKLPWSRQQRRVVYMEGTNQLTSDIVEIHNGPKPEVVALSDFYWSADAIHTGIQHCQWIAHRMVRTWKQIKEREGSGDYYDVDRIKQETRTQPTDMEAQAQEETGVSPLEYTDYELWEIYANYDVDKDKIPEELIVTLELNSRKAVRGVYNFYRHQERPFHLITYMPRDNSILGIGLCQMLEDIQEEITGIHNRRLDNATLANTKVFKRKTNASIGMEEIYPGAFVDVDEQDDIEEMKIGDTYPSLLQEEMHSNSIGEKRTGVSDYTVGRESAAIGSRATATSTMALIREGNKRFQMTIKDIREALRDIGHQAIMLYQQWAPESKVFYELFSEKDQRIVTEFFSLPADYSRQAVVIDVPAVSESDNKDIARQTYLTLMQVLEKFYGGLFQAFQVAISPEAPEPLKQLAIQGATAASKIWERTLEAFDIIDAENFVPDVGQMLGLAAGLEGMGGQGEAIGGGAGGPAGAAIMPPQQAVGAPGEDAAVPVGVAQGGSPTPFGAGGLPGGAGPGI